METTTPPSESNPTSPPQPAHSGPATLLKKVPISLTMTEGTLTLEDGRLRFATSRRTVFDHPVGEFHSAALSASTGMHLWHGSRCYKFVPAFSAVHSINTTNSALDVVVNAARLPDAFAADRRMKDAREEWLEILEPLLGTPPPGVTVRKPWPTWAIWLMIVGVTLVVAGVITAITLLAG